MNATLRNASWGQIAAWVALAGLFAVVVIGLNPLGGRTYDPASAEGDATRQLIFIALTGLAGISAWHARPSRALAIPIPILAGLIWCGLSLSWAIDPGIGLRRLILTVMIIWTIFRSTDELGYEKSIWIIRALLVVTLVLNFIAVAVTPDAIHRTTEVTETNLVGSWRGVLPHKNWAGPICAFTVICFLFDTKRLHRLFQIAILAGALFFLYKTQSKTSMGILAASLICGWMYARYNPVYRALLVPLTIIAGCAIAIYVEARWGSIVTQLDDPKAFTGRAQIWEMLLRYSADHPSTGAGYGSFWNIGPQSPVYAYGQPWLHELGNGHSGYLDLLTQVGLVGTVIIVVAAIFWPITRLLASVSAPRPSGALILALIIFCAGHNLTETSLFDRDMISQVFLMAAVALHLQVTRPLLQGGGAIRPSMNSSPSEAR